MNNAQTLILGAPQILPVIPRDTILRDHALVIRDGVIEAIEPQATARANHPDAEYREHPGQILIPGLVNAHTHSGMSLLRGIGSDRPLMEWLKGYIWPAEGKLLSPEFVRAGTRLSIAEMLRGGTTCFSDMYLFVDDAARVVEETGIRASLGLTVFDFPTPWASTADEYFQRGADVVANWGHHERIAFNVAPHAPYTVGDTSLERVAARARELGVPIHMHVHETASEVADALRDHGERPLARLARLGMLDQPFIAVHMTQVDDTDLDLLRERPVSIAHCPESNLKLASGFCPVTRLQAAGINVALGTDSTASNNDLDMIGEMRTAALLAKGVSGDAAALPATAALEMATLGSARALGLEDRIGSLEPGKQADVVAVDLQALELQPAHDPSAQIVYAATRDAVRDVYVAGRPLLRDRELLTLNLQDLHAEAEYWRIRVLETQQPTA
ncbi:TRZ/ATZ family hydrolase [Thioalkalivibrio sp. ALMg11]|uniref:TRZ/ATZ family hydrolase n=1 Tax=Thioalkalivibrio sp. ALMg11 TaxID=1158165 RepID=UPI00036EAC92|nr:TRZ/ATZ family hydrolase [Thioalkalivibrio sp. ALMg11]